MTQTYAQFRSSVEKDAALSIDIRLQPMIKGGKIQPAVYPKDKQEAGSNHLLYKRVSPTDPEVVLDVASLNNEGACAALAQKSLRDALRREQIKLAVLGVDLGDDGFHLSLDESHRMVAAVFRDALLDGKPFRTPFYADPKAKRKEVQTSPLGQGVDRCNENNATLALEIDAWSLVAGWMNSFANQGQSQSKIAKSFVSEIIAYGSQVGAKNWVRRDGFITGGKCPWYLDAETGDWTPFVDRAKKNEKGEPIPFKAKAGGEGGKSEGGKPSSGGYGTVLSQTQESGVTCQFVRHATLISFRQLANLNFPRINEVGEPVVNSNWSIDEGRNLAARACLAALGLTAIALWVHQTGYSLRSGCVLVPESGDINYTVRGMTGSEASYPLTVDNAIELLNAAIADCKKHGFDMKHWSSNPKDWVMLTPSPKQSEMRRLCLTNDESVDAK